MLRDNGESLLPLEVMYRSLELMGFPGDSVVKNPLSIAEDADLITNWVRKFPWRRKRQPSPAFLPGKSCGQRGLAGYSPQGRKE